MNPGPHNLLMHQHQHIKHAVREKLSETDKVNEQISVDICDQMFYCFKGFHKLPHGSSDWNGQHASETTLLLKGNNNRGAKVYHIKLDDVINSDHDCIRVCYPQSNKLKSFDFFGHGKKRELLIFMLKQGKLQEGKRDKGGEARRMTVGYSQKQPGAKVTRYIGDVLLPFLQTKGINCMERSLRLAVGRILNISERHLKILYGDQQPLPFFNTERNRIYGEEFTGLFSKEHKSSFEFLDIFIEKMSRLNRHLDYNNGRVPGYDFGSSYSYTIKEGQDTYRVNLIMCTRRQVDASMREILR